MQNLRIQLLISHFALIMVMSLVLTGAVANFFHLGSSIDRILRNNYASVVAAQNMKETLERQDSAATFFLAGQKQKAWRQYQQNWRLFGRAYQIEAHNITEPGEGQMADDIGRQFTLYRAHIERLLYASPPMPFNRARDYYFGVLEPAFLHLKQRAQDVLELNQAAIVRGAALARAEAKRASYVGIGVTIGAFCLTLFLALQSISASLAPLRVLARQAEEIGAGHLNQRIELQRTDEIGALATSFNGMAEKLRDARRLEEDRLHRAERMPDAALQSLYDPVIVTDAAGSIVHLNPAAEGLFGPAERAKGQPVAQVIHNPQIGETIERVLSHKQFSPPESEEDSRTVPLRVGGGQRIYRLGASPMWDEARRLIGATMVLEDITHLKELDRLKSEFISVASHELRTPVTSLLLSVQVLEEGAVGQLSDQQKAVIAAQKEDLLRLDRMMRDLLDITRLEAGVTPPRFEIASPRELVHAALGAVEAAAAAKEVSLESLVSVGLPDVRADRAQIVRVLINLLSNAIRHTPQHGSVRVLAEVRGETVAFSIVDTGAGIPREYLPRIFERFVQVPGATRGGAGLGLSIAQTIVRAHGGEIAAESDPGNGSTFTFNLPLLPEKPEKPEGPDSLERMG